MTGSLSFNFKALSLLLDVRGDDTVVVSECSASPSELDSLGPDSKTPVLGFIRRGRFDPRSVVKAGIVPEAPAKTGEVEEEVVTIDVKIGGKAVQLARS